MQVQKSRAMRWQGISITKEESTVLTHLSDAHREKVESNRRYMKVIVETLLFTAQQNIAQRGHEESRQDLILTSDVNRGNFLELLHLRSRDLPWLAEKMKTQLESHMQWTSPRIQNELFDIMGKLVIESIISDVRSSDCFSIIVDETSDISRHEQVSCCLRYVVQGCVFETFIGFRKIESTTGESLCKLVLAILDDTNLEAQKVVGMCFDGASNMTGVKKGLATRMIEHAPKALYVHCYGHLLNLAIQDALSGVEILRNTLGTVQEIYNFIEGSPKRHAAFEKQNIS